jgi:MYXO-CTERM domain-containing protein
VPSPAPAASSGTLLAGLLMLVGLAGLALRRSAAQR